MHGVQPCPAARNLLDFHALAFLPLLVVDEANLTHLHPIGILYKSGVVLQLIHRCHVF